MVSTMNHQGKSGLLPGKSGVANRLLPFLSWKLGLWCIGLSLLVAAIYLAARWPGAGSISGGLPAIPIQIKTVPPFEAVVLPMRGSYAQHATAIDRLQAELRRTGVVPIGPLFGRYINDPAQVREENLQWEVGYQVQPGTRVSPPFEIRRFGEQMVASAHLRGPYQENSLQWPSVYSWLTRSGYFPVGASFEFWNVVSLPGGDSIPESELRVPVGRVRVFPLLFRDLVCLWGAYLFVLFSFLYLRQKRRRRLIVWGGPLWGFLGATCAILYLQPLLSELIYLYSDYSDRRIMVLNDWTGAAGIVIPPLLAHLFFRVTRADLRRPLLFRLSVIAVYALGSILAFSTEFKALPAHWLDRTGQLGDGLVAAAAALSLTMVLVWRASGASSDRERRTYILLLAATIVVALSDAFFAQGSAFNPMQTLLRTLPIPFFFATMYYNERAVFFDIVAKRGLFILAMLILLTGYFALVPAWLWSSRLGWIGSWLFPLTALPLVVLAPWIYRTLSTYLDRRWLGRGLSPSEAHRFFLAVLATATSEENLVSAAEQRLAEIMHGAVHIQLCSQTDPQTTEDEGFETAILLRGERQGAVRIEIPANGYPLLSEDRKLLVSLAESFGLALENLRLREKKLRQERRERDLLLLASQAELRSLRAQINPHFFFNALNSIAALIPVEPEQAEVTVERLSELFRYALRRSDTEWVRVEEEMAFVQCYLDVEKTRFHERLKVQVEQGEAVCRALVPAMMIHTLVENAVKHGIAPVRGGGRIEVRIHRDGDTLFIEVRDSGMGIAETVSNALNTPGHGLKNVQARLQAHFGEGARLTFGRDEDASMTTVCIAMPYIITAPDEACLPT
jgi:signal transduction histidine kinase/DNA gyrase inhibitor GyrI